MIVFPWHAYVPSRHVRSKHRETMAPVLYEAES